MGKGTIIQIDGDGAYHVELNYDKRQLIVRRDTLLNARAALLPQLADAQHAADVAASEAANARGRLDQAIHGGDDTEIQIAAIAAMEASIEEGAAKTTWRLLDADHLSMSRQIDTLTSAINQRDPVVSAWCADYTPELAAQMEVGTVEVPDEYNPDRPVLVRPAWTNDDPEAGAAWDADRDGCLTRMNAMGIYQTWFNACLLPASQNDHPRYRVGELLAVDRDTGVGFVVIDRERSSAGQHTAYERFRADAYSIDPPGAGTNDQALGFEATFRYMDCDDVVFSEKDRVLVEFPRRWSDPVIIGFESNPVPCTFGQYVMTPAAEESLNGWGVPFTDQNSPLGTALPVAVAQPDTEHRRTVFVPDDQYIRGDDERYQSRFPDVQPLAGNCDWSGESLRGKVITWKKAGHRYFDKEKLPERRYTNTSASVLPGEYVHHRIDDSQQIRDNEILSVEKKTVDDPETGITTKLFTSAYRQLGTRAVYSGGVQILNTGEPINGLGAAEYTYTDENDKTKTVTWIIWVEYKRYDQFVNPPVPFERIMYASSKLSGGNIVVDQPSILMEQINYDDEIILPIETSWSFSQSGRKAATIRKFRNQSSGLEYWQQWELDFIVDETGVSISVTTITAASSGVDTWSRSGDFESHQQTLNYTQVAVTTIAVDYKDNQLVKAIARENTQVSMSISERAIFAPGDIHFNDVNQGTKTYTYNSTLEIGGVSYPTKTGTVTEESTFTPIAFGDDGITWDIVENPTDYTENVTTLTTTNNYVEKFIYWIDLRNDFVALTADINNTIDTDTSTAVRAGPFWDWVWTRSAILSEGAIDEYTGAGEIWGDTVSGSFTDRFMLSGTSLVGDAKYFRIDNGRMYSPDQGELNGSFEYFYIGTEPDMSRPKPFVFDSDGKILAMSGPNGFNSVPWRFDKTSGLVGGEWTFSNSPDTLPLSNSIDGKTNPRVGPLLNL